MSSGRAGGRKWPTKIEIDDQDLQRPALGESHKSASKETALRRRSTGASLPDDASKQKSTRRLGEEHAGPMGKKKAGRREVDTRVSNNHMRRYKRNV